MPDAVMRLRSFRSMFGIHGANQPFARVVGEPRRLFRTISQIDEDDDSEEHGRYSFEDEHTLPALQTSDSIHFKQCTGQRRTKHRRNWRCRHEEGYDLCPPSRRKPVAQIQNDARKKSGFGNPQQKAKYVEARLSPDECEVHRNETPCDHDTGDPQARAYAVKNDVRRDLEEEVAQKEDAGTKAKDCGREPKVLVHRQRREANIDAVNERYEIEQHDKRHDAPRDFAQGLPFQLAGHKASPFPHFIDVRTNYDLTLPEPIVLGLYKEML